MGMWGFKLFGAQSLGACILVGKPKWLYQKNAILTCLGPFRADLKIIVKSFQKCRDFLILPIYECLFRNTFYKGVCKIR